MTNDDGGDQRTSLLHHDPHQYNPPDDDSPSLQHAAANYGSAANDDAGEDSAHKKGVFDTTDDDEDGTNSSSRTVPPELLRMPLGNMAAILSTAFAYGCIMTTLFLITLPIECERIHDESVVRSRSNGSGSSTVTPKSVALGVFVAIAGFTQLVSPLVYVTSDDMLCVVVLIRSLLWSDTDIPNSFLVHGFPFTLPTGVASAIPTNHRGLQTM